MKDFTMNEMVKLANETMVDILNRKINLLLDEKILRIKEFNRMITKLEKLRSINCPEILFKKILLPQYISMNSKRLSEMFNWLFLNWKQYARPFPEIPDFEQAKRETNKDLSPETYAPEKRTDFIPYSDPRVREIFDELKGKFSTKKSINRKTENAKNKPTQFELFERMAEAGKVYSVEHGEWLDKKYRDKIPGTIIDPSKKLKQI